jgi:uncharacterized membrane protein
MPPRRRDRKIHDPSKEREMLRRRYRQIPDPTREREMHELRARIDAMEATQKFTVDGGDISKAKSENDPENKEVAVKDATEECLFRDVARIGAR